MILHPLFAPHPMKAVFPVLCALGLGLNLAVAVDPQITITTPAIVRTRPAIISGTATDTSETTEPTAAAGVKEVLYQYEGDKRWRKALITSTDSAETTWMIQIELETARGKRIYFRAVDVAGKESDIRGLRFRRGT